MANNLTLAQLLMGGAGSAAAQILERDMRTVSGAFLTGIIDRLMKNPLVRFGPTTFGRQPNQQQAFQLVFPKSVLEADADLAKLIGWKQGQESVLCPEANMDVKIARIRHDRDENDNLIDYVELIIGSIQQDKNLQKVVPPKAESKK